ncbi:ERF family protein [Streptobacillus moniliformis]|uniref:ERF family protein n=1 Tax=Streptobacillus moniliformis TaxID=34105 RepID=UPI0007E430BD|nr:ERF family protein [Streptobacillus moniliformis]
MGVETLTLHEKLLKIQLELKAPKTQYNKFSDFYYRSCEDILEGLKLLLEKYSVVLTLSDTVEFIEGRHYIKATATLTNTENQEEKIVISAYAREDEKGNKMTAAQVSGSTSTYARKYALNGLFAIDDAKDPDQANNVEDKNQKEELSKSDLLKFVLKKLANNKEKREKILKYYKAKEFGNLSVEQLKEIKSNLE